MKKFFVIFILLFMPMSSFAESFYARETEKERLSWMPFLPHKIIESSFAKLLGEEEEARSEGDYHILINLPARRLSVYRGEELIKNYPVAIGSRRYRTPVGQRFLENIIWNPWWYPPASDWAKNEKPTPPGPANPLGRVKMSLGGLIYMHATNKEYTVGRAASHGCMRMKRKDAMEVAWFFQKKFSDQNDEELRIKYDRFRWSSFDVPLLQKIPVNITYDLVTRKGDDIEIHPDVYQHNLPLESLVFNQLLLMGIAPWEVDPEKLEELKRFPDSTMVPIIDLF